MRALAIMIGMLVLGSIVYSFDLGDGGGLPPGMLEELLGSCGVCGVIDFPDSLIFVSDNENAQEFQVTLVYRGEEGGLERRRPVKDAPIMVYVEGEVENELFRIYTDEEGKAQFSYEDYTEGCHDFQFVYCHDRWSCGFDECLSSIGVDPAEYETMGSIPLESGESEPAGLSDPVAVRPVSTSATYCPPPPSPAGIEAPVFCLPLLLLFALLGGALYMSGRNPFSGFDFSAPRLHKPFQYSARARGMSFSMAGIAAAAGSLAAGAIAIGSGKKGKDEKGKEVGGIKGALMGANEAVKGGGGGQTIMGPGGVPLVVGGPQGHKGERGSEKVQVSATPKETIIRAVPFLGRALGMEGAPLLTRIGFGLADLVQHSSFGVFARSIDQMTTGGKGNWLDAIVKGTTLMGLATATKAHGEARGFHTLETREGKFLMDFDPKTGRVGIYKENEKGERVAVEPGKAPKNVQEYANDIPSQYNVKTDKGEFNVMYKDGEGDRQGTWVAYKDGKETGIAEAPKEVHAVVNFRNGQMAEAAYVIGTEAGQQAKELQEQIQAKMDNLGINAGDKIREAGKKELTAADRQQIVAAALENVPPEKAADIAKDMERYNQLQATAGSARQLSIQLTEAQGKIAKEGMNNVAVDVSSAGAHAVGEVAAAYAGAQPPATMDPKTAAEKGISASDQKILQTFIAQNSTVSDTGGIKAVGGTSFAAALGENRTLEGAFANNLYVSSAAGMGSVGGNAGGMHMNGEADYAATKMRLYHSGIMDTPEEAKRVDGLEPQQLGYVKQMMDAASGEHVVKTVKGLEVPTGRVESLEDMKPIRTQVTEVTAPQDPRFQKQIHGMVEDYINNPQARQPEHRKNYDKMMEGAASTATAAASAKYLSKAETASLVGLKRIEKEIENYGKARSDAARSMVVQETVHAAKRVEQAVAKQMASKKQD